MGNGEGLLPGNFRKNWERVERWRSLTCQKSSTVFTDVQSLSTVIRARERFEWAGKDRAFESGPTGLCSKGGKKPGLE
jgi:hypothetical protein